MISYDTVSQKSSASTIIPSASIPAALQQNIVRSIKDICGQNCIYVVDGRILAATDRTRIGDYHAAGYESFRRRAAIKISDPAQYVGTRKGIVTPLIHNGVCLGVIGITGDPDDVSRYVSMSCKVASLLVREQQISVESRSQRSQINYCMRTLLTGPSQGINPEYIKDLLSSRHLKNYKNYRIILVQFNSRLNPANLSLIEQEILNCFNQTGSDLYVFNYPDEYALLLEDVLTVRYSYLFASLSEKTESLLKIGIGEAVKMDHVPDSYRSAKLALHSMEQFGGISWYDQLGVIALAADLSPATKLSFTARTVGRLSEKERSTLRSYFEHNTSLQETSRELFIHRNTLQYQLNQIHEETGLDPRNFKDAVQLYMGLLIQDGTGPHT